MDFDPRDYCDERDPRERDRDERDRDDEDVGCRSDADRPLYRSITSIVSVMTSGTRHVTERTTAIATMRAGPSAIAILAIVMPIRARRSRVA
jgi:hypothetical protein